MKKIYKNIILFGAPAAGKGTLSSILIKKLKYKHLSTGNLFREEIQKETELGLKIKSLIERGMYAPDEITNQIVEKHILNLLEKKEHFILDGFPRTINQLNFLKNLFTKLNIDFPVCFELFAPLIVLQDRLEGRQICSKCGLSFHKYFNPSDDRINCNDCKIPLIRRKDDEWESVKKRFEVYEKETKDLFKEIPDKFTLTCSTVSDNITDFFPFVKEKVIINEL